MVTNVENFNPPKENQLVCDLGQHSRSLTESFFQRGLGMSASKKHATRETNLVKLKIFFLQIFFYILKPNGLTYFYLK